MANDRIASWLPYVESALENIAREDPSVKKITPALVLAFIEHESAGKVNVYVPRTSTSRTVEKNNKTIKTSGTALIMGGFQGSTNWYNAYARAPGAPKIGSSLEYGNRIRSNPQVQTEDFLRSMTKRKSKHFYRPDLMAIMHARCGSGSCIDENDGLLSKLAYLQLAELKAGRTINGNVDDVIRFSKGWYQPSRKKTGLMYDYARGIYDKYIKWASILGEPDPRNKFIADWAQGEEISVPEYTVDPNKFQTLSGFEASSFTDEDFQGVPFISGRYITPEEARKGIIAEVFHLNDWHLLQIDDPEQKSVDLRKNSESEAAVDQAVEDVAVISPIYGAAEAIAEDVNKKIRSDFSINARQRFIQSMVEGEYFRRKYSTRNLAPITGPFNPYPVSGFSGLIMDPVRPVMGYIDSITHNINIASGQGTTSVSMSFPRYWDEGDIYYWIGGNEKEDPQSVMRKFPRWFNRLVVATNNYKTQEGKRFRNSTLDNYYNFMLGSDCVDFESNHANLNVTDEMVTKAIAERDPGSFDVSPVTLTIRDYNQAIAKRDDKGRFLPNTLAGKIFGNIQPAEDLQVKMPIDDVNAMRERYGVSEVELLKDFMGNDFTLMKDDHLVWYGPTFGSFEDDDKNIRLNQIQQAVVNYTRELQSRQLQ